MESSSSQRMFSLHYAILVLVILFLSTSIQSVVSFSARRQYHSYHHLSQYNKSYHSIEDNNSSSSVSIVTSRPQDEGKDDEIELLLEKAAKIRNLAAYVQQIKQKQRQVQLTSSRHITSGD